MTATALCGQALVGASPSSASTLSPQNKILLVSFTNSTKDGDFDDSLKEAVRTALEESPFLNIIPEATLAGAMKEMGRDENAPFTLQLARQLGQQVGSRAYLVGSISKQGSEFALALEATDCMSGKTLAREQSIAPNKEKVLDALEKAASDLRTHLGESLASVQKFNTPLSTATTSSLEALQAWALGLRIKQEKGPAETIAALENATKLDPDFASALFDLGLIYRNSQQEILARNLFIKAFAVRSHATARKRFSIEGLYYSFVTVDYDKTVETYRQWMRIYPRD